MKRRHISNSYPQSIRPFMGCMCPFQVSRLVNLRCRKMLGSSTGETIYGYADDIELLLMQRGFDNINSLEYSAFLKDIESNMASYSAPTRPKMTDEQLMSYIKSRHIQSASELSSWFNYLNSQYDINLKSLRDVVSSSNSDDSPDSDTSGSSATSE